MSDYEATAYLSLEKLKVSDQKLGIFLPKSGPKQVFLLQKSETVAFLY